MATVVIHCAGDTSEPERKERPLLEELEAWRVAVEKERAWIKDAEARGVREEVLEFHGIILRGFEAGVFELGERVKNDIKERKQRLRDGGGPVRE